MHSYIESRDTEARATQYTGKGPVYYVACHTSNNNIVGIVH